MAKSTHCKLLCASGIVPVALFAAGTAHAAEAPVVAVALQATPAAGEAKEAGPTGNEIVVTARRREESLQSVPVAVTALGSGDLVARGIESASDLVTSTPGLQVQPGLEGRTAARFYIRGQGVGFGGAPPSVVPYFNEVPLEINGGATFALNDVESVQVLRGPQGTLFGRNANGGAVLITPKAPGHDSDAFVDLSYGNYNFIKASAGITVPISDTLGVRFSGEIVRRDGYTKNLSGKDLDNIDNKSWRVFVRWDPSDAIRNDLVYAGFRGKSNGIGTIIAAVRPGTPAATAYPLPGLEHVRGPGLTSDLELQKTLGPRVVDDPSTYFGEDTTIHLVTNTTTVDVGDFTFKNIFGYESVKACASLPVVSSPTNFFVASCFDNYLNRNLGVDIHPSAEHSQITEEFNISGTLLDGRLDVIAGAFLMWVDPSNGGLGEFYATRASKSLFIANVSSAPNKDRSQAVYAQGTFSITDNLKFTAGLRYTWDQRTQQFGQMTSRANGAAGTFQCVTPGLDAATPTADCFKIYKRNYDDYGYTFGLDYQATPDLLLYVTTRRGYKSGGANNTSVAVDPFYDPEILEDVEAGLKYSWQGNGFRGRFNAAYFHMWYSGIQQQLSIIQNGGATVVTTNAGGAKLDGVELEADVTIGDRLNLSAFYTYLKSSYNKCPGGILDPSKCFVDSGQDVTDSLLVNTPKHSFGATLTYTQPIGFADLRAMVTYYTRAKQAFAADNVINYEGVAPGYEVVNARLDLANIGDSGLTIGAFVDNLFDKDYIATGLGLGGLIGTTTHIYGEPRTYGVNLRYSF